MPRKQSKRKPDKILDHNSSQIKSPNLNEQLVEDFSEAIENDPQLLKAFLAEHGIDQEQLVKKGLELIQELKEEPCPGPTSAKVSKQMINPPFESFRPGICWKIKRQIGFVLRVMTSGEISQLIPILGFITLLTIYLALWLSNVSFSLSSNLLMGFLLLLLIWALPGYWAVYMLSRLAPEKYAQITMQGARLSKIFQYISYEIWRVGNNFLKHKSLVYLEKFASDKLLKGPNLIAKPHSLESEKAEIKKHIKKMEYLLNANNKSLQIIKAMKYLFASVIDMPVQRICDYLVQFSPDLFSNRAAKYLENWKEIIQIQNDSEDFDLFEDRFKGLLEDNRRICEKIKSRTGFQLQHLKYTDLHEHIFAFLSDNSTSASLKNYVQAVTFVAQQAEGRLNNDGVQTVFLDASQKLKFLYYKQKAHPGFDLHMACYKLCRKKSASPIFVNLANTLKKIQENSVYNIFPENEEQAKLELLNLARLFEKVNVVIEDNRNKIIENFAEEYGKWDSAENDSETGPQKIIVTHKYSKTVREVLKRVVFSKENETRGSKQSGVPKVLIMKSNEKETFEARLMMFELKEDDELQNMKENFTGNENALVNTKIMVILGAEAFDKNRWVLQSPRDANRLRKLKALSKKKGNEIIVVVVGESYKFHDSLFDLSEFYQDRFDNIFLYEPELIDVIITDEKVIKATEKESEEPEQPNILTSIGPFEQLYLRRGKTKNKLDQLSNHHLSVN